MERWAGKVLAAWEEEEWTTFPQALREGSEFKVSNESYIWPRQVRTPGV